MKTVVLAARASANAFQGHNRATGRRAQDQIRRDAGVRHVVAESTRCVFTALGQWTVMMIELVLAQLDLAWRSR